MTALRLRAVRWALASAAVVLAALLATAWRAAVMEVEEPAGALPRALETVARQEAARLRAELARVQPRVDDALEALLRLADRPVDNVALPWLPGGCRALAGIPVAARAGAWNRRAEAPVMAVEQSPAGCADRLGALSVAVRTGPPFPAARDVTRVSQWAHLGVEDAEEAPALVAAWRDGARASWRWARRRGDVVAFVDVAPARLPGAPAGGGVRLDSVLRMDGVVIGYASGGPEPGKLPDALAGVRRGEVRALDLPELAAAQASLGVLAWLQPQSVRSHLAGVVELPLETRPRPVTLAVIASMPRPLGVVDHGPALVALWAGALAAFLVFLLLAFNPLARVLWSLANQTREAWLGLREDDVGSPDDMRRAAHWLGVLTDHAQRILVTALGHAERFWSPSPMARLVRHMRERLDREP